MDDTAFTFENLPYRGVSKEVMARFGISTKINPEGKPIAVAARRPNGSVQVRLIEEKKFFSQGDMSTPGLFFSDKFNAGSNETVIITEGWLDATSVAQIMGPRQPVVSPRSASSAKKDCAAEYDYLNSFDRIYICFDNDDAGRIATAEVAGLFDFNKVYNLKLTKWKDANDYLTHGDIDEFRRTYTAASRFLPEGIVSSLSDFHKIIEEDSSKESITYPFPTIQEKTYGIRTGEVVLLTAMEGIGKTEIVRAIEYHILKSTKENVGVIHLEEPKSRQLKGLAGYELACPVHLPDTTASKEEINKAIDRVVGRTDRLHIYSHFGSDDPNTILNTIRFMVTACGCKYIIFDHITMVVTGMETDDERRTLDYLSTRLATMVHDLDFALILVSHINAQGGTRGSANISKIAHLWVHLDRRIDADDPNERNLTKLTLKKNRFASSTGPAGILVFDPSTFKVTEQGVLPT